MLHRLHLVEGQLRIKPPHRCPECVLHPFRNHTAAQNNPAVGCAQFTGAGQHSFTRNSLCYRLEYLLHRLRIARLQLDAIPPPHHPPPRPPRLPHPPPHPSPPPIPAPPPP